MANTGLLDGDLTSYGGMSYKGGTICAICRNELEDICIGCHRQPLPSCSILQGSCHHLFHKHCIARWLESPCNFRCPLCDVPWRGMSHYAILRQQNTKLTKRLDEIQEHFNTMEEKIEKIEKICAMSANNPDEMSRFREVMQDFKHFTSSVRLPDGGFGWLFYDDKKL